MVVSPTGHLNSNGSNGNHRHITKYSHGRQQPSGQHHSDEAPFGAQCLDNRLGNPVCSTAFNQCTGQNTSGDNPDDGRYDTLRSGNNIIYCATQSGSANKATDDSAKNHGVSWLHFL